MNGLRRVKTVLSTHANSVSPDQSASSGSVSWDFIVHLYVEHSICLNVSDNVALDRTARVRMLVWSYNVRKWQKIDPVELKKHRNRRVFRSSIEYFNSHFNQVRKLSLINKLYWLVDWLIMVRMKQKSLSIYELYILKASVHSIFYIIKQNDANSYPGYDELLFYRHVY